MKTFYKLTTEDNYTRKGEENETLWKLKKWHKVSGKGDLCTAGWFHLYHSADLAVILNPIHANIQNPKLWECEVKGKHKDNRGLKIGWSEVRIVKEIPLPVWTINQKIAFGILCAKEVCKNKEWNIWADNWFSGKDRSYAAAYAADAAYAAAYAATYAANAADAAESKKLNFNKLIKQAKLIV